MQAGEGPPQTLTRSAIRAGRATSVMTGLENLLILLRTLVLSRLLEPREFGLIGMAFIAISTAEVLSQTGFVRSIVQMPADPRPYLSTLWTVSAVRGAVLVMLVVLLSPLLGSFFQAPALVPVLQAVSIIMLLRGLANPRWYLLERDLRPALLQTPRIVGVILDLFVTTILALQLRSVWAMVGGLLAGAVLELALTYAVAPFRPRLVFNRGQAAHLYSYGKHIFRSDLINCLVEQADRICVGRLRPTSEMGLYSFGVRLALFPSLSLYSIIVRVAFPAFARIQTDPLRVREAMGRLLGLITLMAFPLATGVALTSPVFVPLLFGEKWRPVVPVLQMLSFAGATNLMQSVLSSVASSVGRPQISVRASVLRLAVVSLAVPATMWYGIEGSAAAVLVSSVCSCLFLLVQVTRFLGTSAARYGPVLLTPIVSSAAMAAAILWIRPWVSNWSGVLQLLTMVGVGATIYITMALALDRRGSTGMASELMSVLRPNRAGRGA